MDDLGTVHLQRILPSVKWLWEFRPWMRKFWRILLPSHELELLVAEERQWRRVLNESDTNVAGEKGAGFLYFYKRSAESVFVNDKTNMTEKPEIGKLQCRIRGYKLGCIKRIHFINISVLFFGHLWWFLREQLLNTSYESYILYSLYYYTPRSVFYRFGRWG